MNNPNKIIMNGITVYSSKEQTIITINNNILEKEYIINLLDRLKIEYYAQKANFDESVLDLAEDITEKWWRENKSNYMKGVKI